MTPNNNTNQQNATMKLKCAECCGPLTTDNEAFLAGMAQTGLCGYCYVDGLTEADE